MDPLDESKSFLKHVFSFDKDSKGEMMNIVQYAVMAVVPIIALNKIMHKYIPETDDQKSTIEILAEVIGQLIILFIGHLLINRMITYIPTYSGLIYPEYNTVTNIMGVLTITLSLQTKLGDKASILTNRVLDAWNGTESFDTAKQQAQGDGQAKLPHAIAPRAIQGADGTTSIRELPPAQLSSSQPPIQQALHQPQMPDYGGQHQNEPVAMSEYGGYENFGTW